MRFIKPAKSGKLYTGQNPIMPTTEDIIIPAETYIGQNLTITGEEELTPENILYRKIFFGIKGIFGREIDHFKTFTSRKVTEKSLELYNEYTYRYIRPNFILMYDAFSPRTNSMADTIMLNIDYSGQVKTAGIAYENSDNYSFFTGYHTWSVEPMDDCLQIDMGLNSMLKMNIGDSIIFNPKGVYCALCIYLPR